MEAVDRAGALAPARKTEFPCGAKPDHHTDGRSYTDSDKGYNTDNAHRDSNIGAPPYLVARSYAHLIPSPVYRDSGTHRCCYCTATRWRKPVGGLF